MKRLALPSVLFAASALAAPAAARTEIHPYIEVQQVFSADLSGHDDDAVTYTGAAAGVDATLDGAHVQGQIDYRYDHYFAWSKRYRDTDSHNGLASIQYQPTQDISLNAAGIATRTRGAFGGPSAAYDYGDPNNTQQVYSIEAGPSLATHVGDLSINADYRFAWTRSDDGYGGYDLGPGQPVLQNDFDTTSHMVDASVGTRPGGYGLPFGWRVSGGWNRDSVSFLGARLDSYHAQADITLPVSDTLAVEGGAGYEKDRASQDAILTDADGNAILDGDRHLQADHGRGRILSYDEDGLIWDVGVLWRPSARTSLEVRGGRRYGETVVTGRFQHQLSPQASVEVVAYDDVTSFGRQLSAGLNGLPTRFSSFASPIPTTVTGCVFGVNGGQGGCLPALNGVTSNFYRSRGVYADLSGTRGLWTYGLGVGYEHRRYLAPDDGSDIFNFAGATDQSVSFNGVLGRKLSPVSGVTLNGLASWYDSDVYAGGSYWIYGATGTYYRDFSRRLTGSASISVSSGSGGGQYGDVIGSAVLSMRYTM